MSEGVMRKYQGFLDISTDTPVISMGEGSTPLVRSRSLEKKLMCGELYFKLEGCNPTGSFKDRGMVVAVSKAIESGSKAIICASTGNTSASAAAYGAYCGLTTVVLVPAGNVAPGKMAQARAFGASIMPVKGTFDEALQLVRAFTESHPITLVNSVNPYRIDGQKTAAFEIVDEIGDAPDYLFIPVGNAGNITAYWKGFSEYLAAGISGKLPQMMGWQASGAAPIVLGTPVLEPQTLASAIRIGNPASWTEAIVARDESGGHIGSVSDEEILNAYSMLARLEGVFGEPASAASLAGLIKFAAEGRDLSQKKIVCVITGNGLKDPDMVQNNGFSNQDIPLNLEQMEQALEEVIGG